LKLSDFFSTRNSRVSFSYLAPLEATRHASLDFRGRILNPFLSFAFLCQCSRRFIASIGKSDVRRSFYHPFLPRTLGLLDAISSFVDEAKSNFRLPASLNTVVCVIALPGTSISIGCTLGIFPPQSFQARSLRWPSFRPNPISFPGRNTCEGGRRVPQR